MSNSLLPLTRFVLAVSAIVLFVFALLWLVAPSFVNSFLWPPPFAPLPAQWLRFDAALYLAMSLGAVYALRENNWIAARTYLAIAGSYVAMNIIISLIAVVSPPGAPLILWLYIFLAAIYVPLVIIVWRQESARGEPA